MLELERKGGEVYCLGRKLTIVAQATKGEGKEVVKIEGLEGSNGQKWVSLSRLQEGTNTLECSGKVMTTSTKVMLTDDEAKEIAELQARIDTIKDAAKARYKAQPKLVPMSSIASMTEEEKLAKIEEIKAYYGF